jgi:hypothetical protein
MLANPWDEPMPILTGEKRRHYWIWSVKPDKGKTTWLKSLEKKYKTSVIGYGEKYQDINADT